MRDLLPVICSGRARRASGSSSSTGRILGLHDPARPTFGGWPPPRRLTANLSDFGRSHHARACLSKPVGPQPDRHQNLVDSDAGSEGFGDVITPLVVATTQRLPERLM